MSLPPGLIQNKLCNVFGSTFQRLTCSAVAHPAPSNEPPRLRHRSPGLKFHQRLTTQRRRAFAISATVLCSTALLASLGVFSIVGAGASRFTGLAVAAVPLPVAAAVVKICLLFVAAGVLCWSSEYLPGVHTKNASLTSSPAAGAFVLPKRPLQHAAPSTGPLCWDDAAAAADGTLERSGVFRRTQNIRTANLRPIASKAGVANTHMENAATEGITDDVSYGEPTPEKYCAVIVAGLGCNIERTKF